MHLCLSVYMPVRLCMPPQENIERGYFGVYFPGHDLGALHLDNHHTKMSPQRAVSFVIYLTTNDDDGMTVFPLAKGYDKKANDGGNDHGGEAEEEGRTMSSLRTWWQEGLGNSTAAGSDALQEYVAVSAACFAYHTL